ncbi:MAG: AbrB/MazE/SpoVT family DNA-binding domain-containing protein [Opitutaceae bacterium]|nr:AbrB/MazE/SpoVT family DNA-binding domain-containing protein [Opitutaceae bacterium]MBP9914168.1 AbrB/MazE/SpoVT family DNA-binding domain-containing protein [Opitutaceae bacterium]
MLTKIVPIGNSRGIRIPKAMLDHCGFGDEAELQARNGALILRPVNTPRAGWAEAFAGMAAAKDDFLVQEEAPVSTQFEEEEWEW